MKKKISVISLSLLFFVSTTGLPFVVNFCTMMGTPDTDMCEMHSEHNKTCECEAHKLLVNSEISKDDCCKTEIVDKSIHDKYLQNNIQKFNLNQSIALIISSDIQVYDDLFINPVRSFNDVSPPSLINNHIYLNNSILLI